MSEDKMDYLISNIDSMRQDIDSIKADITTVKLETKLIRQDMAQTEARLTQRLRSNHSVNTRHHLETRAMIADLNQRMNGQGGYI